MPSITRWFPVSHDINSDPEVNELTDKFGLTGLKVWLEMLSIGDRNHGVVFDLRSGDMDALARSLAIKCNSTRSRVTLVLDWTQTRLWVECDSTVRLRNYRKYHRNRVTASAPSLPYPLISSNNNCTAKIKETTESTSCSPAVSDASVPDARAPEPAQLKLVVQEPKEPDVAKIMFERFWKAYPRKIGKRKAYDAFRKTKPTEPLLMAMIAAITKQKTWADWIRDKGRYIPHPTTWLNQERWLDEEFKPLKAERRFVG